MSKNCVIIANGGAGGITHPLRRKNGLVKAVRVGYSILAQGGSSLDAVEKRWRDVENTCLRELLIDDDSYHL